MALPDGSVIYFIQTELYNGRKPNSDGFYIFSRKELSEGAKISPTTFDAYKQNVIEYFTSWCELKRWAKYDEYEGEMLYVDVSFERGKLRFRQNPITIKSELSHLWALPPLSDYFSYDYFDEKHRRRCSGRHPIHDAIPWSWDADLYEVIIADGSQEKVKDMITHPICDDIIMQQAKRVFGENDVALVLCGYRPNTLSKVLYEAVGNMLPELCEFLLQNGANPNEIIQNGYSAMNHTGGMNNKGSAWEKVVRLLIEYGGDLTAGNFNACSFAGNIFEKGSQELRIYFVDELEKQNLLNYVSITNNTPLSCAKIYARDNVVVDYIQTKINKKNNWE